jgi:tetratricopeptide (TPR) repeat protein
LFYGALLANLAVQRGTVDELIALIEQLASESPGITEALTAARAAAYAEVGRLDEAHELLEQFAAAGFNPPPDPGNWLLTMTQYAAVCVACRDTDLAATLFNRLEPFADQVPTTVLTAFEPVSYHLGTLAAVLGRYDAADNYLTRADQFNDRAGAKFFAVNTNVARGNMLVQRDAPGDVERARHLFKAAHTAAATNGYDRA